jgi:hypothetical protein
MKKVLIITYYWPPAGGPGVQRVLKFAKYLPQFGWQPIILTVKNGEYPAIDETLESDIPAECQVYKTSSLEPNQLYKKFVGMKKEERIRVAVMTEANKNWKKKIAGWVRLNLIFPDAKIGWKPSALKVGKKVIDELRPDLIFSSSPPPTTHRIARSLSKKSKLPWVADFRDPWTNIYYYDKAPKSKFAQMIDHKLEKQTLNDADKVITVTKGFFTNFDHSKEIQIPNGFDSDDIRNIEPKAKNKKFTIRYMGFLKTKQYVESFFDILKELSQLESYRENIKLEIIGNLNPIVQKRIEEKAIEMEVNFINYKNHDEALTLIVNADLLLLIIGISNVNRKLLSGKVFEYLMAKKPILAYGPTDGAAAQLLENTKSGKMFQYEDYKNAKQFILVNYERWNSGGNFHPLAALEISQYERKKLTESLVKVFEDVI